MQPDPALSFLIAVGSLVLPACYDADRHTEHAHLTAPVSTVRVDVGSGDVSVEGADVADVSVTARIEGPANHLGSSLAGDTLTLFDDCHERHCSVDVHAVVPAGVALELHTGSGDIEVNRMLGTLALHTGSGDITGTGLAAIELAADSGSGDILLQVSEPVENVRLETGSGDVALGVPSGNYRIAIESGSGDRRLHNVVSDAGAPGSIEIRTGSGDVTIAGY